MSRVVWLAVLGCACSSVVVVDSRVDAGVFDAGVFDAGGVDAGGFDAGGFDAGGFDAGGFDAGGFDAGVPCAGDAGWSCVADGTAKQRCAGGQLETTPCDRGCLKPATSSPQASCLSTTDTFSCSGKWGTEKSKSGDYFITAFGCWVDASGTVHTDPGDNCIPTCLAEARSSGLCQATDTGPQCEERVTWYTADAARFGCLAHVKITNPTTGKSVIAVALDFGPGCSVENGQQFQVLDTSGRIDRYLFGSDQGATDRSLVHVVEVSSSTPLGPIP